MATQYVNEIGCYGHLVWYENGNPFFRRVTGFLIRDGQEIKETGFHVIQEMILQISLYYTSLPDIRDLYLYEIEFFYNGLKPTLKKLTKPT